MASWKKILTSGSAVEASTLTLSGLSGASETTALMINSSNVVSTRALGSNAFTSTTIGTTTAALTSGPGLSGSFTFNGAAARTLSVDSASLAAFYSSSAFSKVSGDVQIAGTGVATIQADSVEGTMLHTNAADTTTLELSSDSLSVLKVPNALTAGTGISAGGTFDGAAARTFAVDIDGLSAETMATGDTIAFNDDDDNGLHKITVDNLMITTPKLVSEDTIAQASDYILFLDGGATGDTKKESVADFVDAINGTGLGASSGVLNVDLSGESAVTIGASTSEVTVGDNLTVAGDLTVNGATTTITSTNTQVKDPFIFLASGSSGTNLDAGIIVQSGSAHNSGSALYHDTSKQRWAVTKQVGKTHTGSTLTEQGMLVTAQALGDDGAPVAADVKYGVGEIAIKNNGEVWIYS